MLQEMGGTYDPEYIGKSNYVHIDPEIWPESIRSKVDSSLSRYNHYINSDIIKQHEIPKVNWENLILV